MADTVTVTKKRVYTQECGGVRPRVTIGDRGVAALTAAEAMHDQQRHEG